MKTPQGKNIYSDSQSPNQKIRGKNMTELDIKEAAEKYRLEQAKHLIESILYYDEETGSNKRLYVYDEKTGGYKSVIDEKTAKLKIKEKKQ